MRPAIIRWRLFSPFEEKSPNRVPRPEIRSDSVENGRLDVSIAGVSTDLPGFRTSRQRAGVNKGKEKKRKRGCVYHGVTELIIGFFWRVLPPPLFFLSLGIVPRPLCVLPLPQCDSTVSVSLLRGSRSASDGFEHLANSNFDWIKGITLHAQNCSRTFRFLKFQ